MIFGVGQSELPWGLGGVAEAADVTRVCQEIKSLGATSIRMSALWLQIDPNRNHRYVWGNLDRAIDSATAAGLDILLIVEPRRSVLPIGVTATTSMAADYGLLCGAIAQRYSGRIRWYEIGNEVNNLAFFGAPKTPAKYLNFLREAFTNIMAADSEATVLAGALQAVGTGWPTLHPVEWVEAFYDSNPQEWFHGLSMHPYSTDGNFNPLPPTPDNEFAFKNIDSIRAIMDANGDTAKKIFCTEWGYDSMRSLTGLSTTDVELEAEQAQHFLTHWNILKTYADSGAIYDTTWVFMYRDWEQANKKAQNHFGMVHFDYTRKPEWSALRNVNAPWPGVADDAVGVTDTATIVLKPPAFPATDVVGVTDTATFTIPSGVAEFVSVGSGDRDTTAGLETILTWTHVVTAESDAAFLTGLVVSTDHLKDWSLYNTLTVTSDLDGALVRGGSRHISASSIKKGSVHVFGLANTDGSLKRPTVGTHAMTAHVKLNNDFVTSINAVAANSVLYRNIAGFSGTVYSKGSNTGGGTPTVTANSDVGNVVFVVMGGTNDMAPTFNKNVRHSAGSTVGGDGDYILIGDAAGANTVTASTTLIGAQYGALAFDLVHTAGAVEGFGGGGVGGGGTGGGDTGGGTGGSTSSSFVIRDGTTGNLMLDGKRFRFGGANVANDIGLVGSGNGNAYGGTVHSGSYLTPHAQVDAVLNSAKQMKLGVLKATWSVHTTNHVDAVQPSLGVFNAAALDPIDYAIQQAKTMGIRFELPFSEEYTNKPWYVSVTGGGDNDNFYTRQATINAYKAHISFVLDHVNPYTGVRLGDEPQIIWWQIGNEFLAPNITNAQYTAWADDIGHHIKVVKGAQQLVQDGHYGVIVDSLSATFVDAWDQHAYDKYRTPSFLDAEGASCHRAGKAYGIGEFDVYHTDGWNLEQQLDGFERSPNIDGGTFWDLLAPLTNWSDGFTLHYPGDSDNMQARGDMLSDWAQRMAGITPKVFVSDTFTGVNGTALSSHVGETGAVWDFQNGWAGVATIQNNRLYAASESHYYSSGVPASADYTVSADVYIASNLSGSYAGVIARSFTKLDYHYTAYVWNNGGTVGVYLDYESATTGTTNLGSATITTPTVGINYTLSLRVQGSSLSVYWGTNPTPVVTVTNSTLPAAGRVGVILGGSTSSTGFHLDTLTATDPAGAATSSSTVAATITGEGTVNKIGAGAFTVTANIAGNTPTSVDGGDASSAGAGTIDGGDASSYGAGNLDGGTA